jgi:hypothetical protein
VIGRRSRAALVMAGLLAGSCASTSGCGSAGSPSGSGAGASGAGPTAEPLAAYVSTLSTARYADYAQRSGAGAGAGVRDETAFEAMRQYLVHHYEGVQATTNVVSDGIVFDCIRQAGGTVSPPTASAAPAGSGTGSQGPSGSAAEQAVTCPSGSMPVRRITLNDLTRFPTLAAFLSKGPGAVGAPPTGTPPS